MTDTIFHYTPIINMVILMGVTAFLISRAHKWSLPIQSHQIRMLEEDVRIVRGNVLRLERDQVSMQRQWMETNEQILKEVRSITANGALHPICDELKVIEDRLQDVEQVMASMPCAPKCAETAKAPEGGQA